MTKRADMASQTHTLFLLVCLAAAFSVGLADVTFGPITGTEEVCPGYESLPNCQCSFLVQQQGSTSPPCPRGYYCVGAGATPQPCPPGFFCGFENHWQPLHCCGGAYCSNDTLTMTICPAGTFCRPGLTQPIECSFFFNCPLGSVRPEGTFVFWLILSGLVVVLGIVYLFRWVWHIFKSRRRARARKEIRKKIEARAARRKQQQVIASRGHSWRENLSRRLSVFLRRPPLAPISVPSDACVSIGRNYDSRSSTSRASPPEDATASGIGTLPSADPTQSGVEMQDLSQDGRLGDASVSALEAGALAHPGGIVDPLSVGRGTSANQDISRSMSFPVIVHPGPAIMFENLSLQTRTKGFRLYKVSGEFRPGRMCAILGGSGSGKTTMLHLILNKQRATSGKMHVDGREVGSLRAWRRVTGYVPQDDILYTELSVWNNIRHTAALRAPPSTNFDDINYRANEVIVQLGLSDVAEQRVGDVKNRSLSGGQVKRVNVGCELVSDCRILLLDEPTSGLDGTQALHLTELLRTFTEDNKITTAAVVHQPRREIFFKFHDLLVLGKSDRYGAGRVVYCGPTECVLMYFSMLGFHFDAATNPADVVLDVVTEPHRFLCDQNASNQIPVDVDDLAEFWRITRFKFLDTKQLVGPFSHFLVERHVDAIVANPVFMPGSPSPSPYRDRGTSFADSNASSSALVKGNKVVSSSTTPSSIATLSAPFAAATSSSPFRGLAKRYGGGDAPRSSSRRRPGRHHVVYFAFLPVLVVYDYLRDACLDLYEFIRPGPLVASPPYWRVLYVLVIRNAMVVMDSYVSLVANIVIHFLVGLAIGYTARNQYFLGPIPDGLRVFCPIEVAFDCSKPVTDEVLVVGMFLCIGISFIGVASAVYTFGGLMPQFWRESSRGLNSPIYFVSKLLVDAVRIFALSVAFTAGFLLTFPNSAPYGDMFVIVLGIYLNAFALGYAVSNIFSTTMSILLGVLLSLVLVTVLGGVLSSLADTPDAFVGFLYSISYPRWAIEAFYISQIRMSPSYGLGEVLNYIGYQESDYGECIMWTYQIAVITIGISFVFLLAFHRSKRR